MKTEKEIRRRIVERIFKSIYNTLDKHLYNGKFSKRELDLTETYIDEGAKELLWSLEMRPEFQMALIIVIFRSFLKPEDRPSKLSEDKLDELIDKIKIEMTEIKENERKALDYWKKAYFYLGDVISCLAGTIALEQI